MFEGTSADSASRSAPPAGERRPDWLRDGLAGQVHTVRVDVSPIPPDEDEPASAETQFYSFTTYSSSGQRTSDLFGDFSYFTYPEKGAGLLALFHPMPPLDTSLDWRRIARVKSSLDIEGNLAHEAYCDSSGRTLWACFCSYNAQGRKVRADLFGPSGKLMKYCLYDYNGDGTPAAETIYSPDRALEIATFHSEYSMDSQGNWTGRRSEVIDDSIDICSAYLMRRQITYYQVKA